MMIGILYILLIIATIEIAYIFWIKNEKPKDKEDFFNCKLYAIGTTAVIWAITALFNLGFFLEDYSGEQLDNFMYNMGWMKSHMLMIAIVSGIIIIGYLFVEMNIRIGMKLSSKKEGKKK